MIESPMVKLLILDFDGTLADTRDKIVAVLQYVMAGQGLPVADAKTCASVIGYHLKQCFQIIYPHLTDAEADGCVDAYRRYFAAHEQSLVPELFPQVREALEVFHREGVRMAIASSRTSKSLCSFVAAMGLSDYFPLVVGGEDVERAKPAPDAVLAILSATGVFGGRRHAGRYPDGTCRRSPYRRCHLRQLFTGTIVVCRCGLPD